MLNLYSNCSSQFCEQTLLQLYEEQISTLNPFNVLVSASGFHHVISQLLVLSQVIPHFLHLSTATVNLALPVLRPLLSLWWSKGSV